MRVIVACSSCTEFRRDHIVFVGGHGYYFALRPLPMPTSNLLRRKWLLLVWQVLLSEGFFFAMLGMTCGLGKISVCGYASKGGALSLKETVKLVREQNVPCVFLRVNCCALKKDIKMKCGR